MKDQSRAVTSLVSEGFNELQMCRDGPMLYNKHDIYVGGSLRKYGEFSIAEQELFAQIVQPDMIVVEAGANIGAHTVFLSRRVGHRGQIHAFEPQRIVFQTLCANIALIQLTNVHARQVAVGSQAGTVLVPAVNPTAIANFGGVSLVGVEVGEPTPLITIDDLDLPACHFLKADVEGMELEVIEGARRTIDTYRPVMYLENDRQERSDALLTKIRDLQYSAYWHLAPLFRPSNYAGDVEDIFPNIHSVNILCLPLEAKRAVQGFPPVTSPKHWWRS